MKIQIKNELSKSLNAEILSIGLLVQKRLTFQ